MEHRIAKTNRLFTSFKTSAPCCDKIGKRGGNYDDNSAKCSR